MLLRIIAVLLWLWSEVVCSEKLIVFFSFLVVVTIYHTLIAGENTQPASEVISWSQSEMPKGGKKGVLCDRQGSQVR